MGKLRLDYFLSTGGKLAKGDLYHYLEVFGEFEVEPDSVERFNTPEIEDQGVFIASFVDRENKGKQPVPDDFPVSVEWSDGLDEKSLGKFITWNGVNCRSEIESWKPDYEELLKMQHERDKHNESIIKACDEANKKGSEMVYTQEMKDNDELPRVGMKVSLRGIVEQDRRNIDLEEHCVVDTWMNGDELMTVASVKMNKGDLTPVMQNLRTYEVSTVLFKLLHPVKTQEEIEQEKLHKHLLSITEFMRSLSRNLSFNDCVIEMHKKGYIAEPK